MTLDFELTILLALLSIISGLGSYFQGIRDKRINKGIIGFLAEISLSMCVGVTVGMIGHAFDANPAFTCAGVMILSNNSQETMHTAKQSLFALVGQRLGLNNRSNNK
ncbi:hypothetical protein [Thaumasiovibrio sp. DFM-14]|uniref:hypothetical protein n=1 Tax=Thaumasiovibrio sp. DFM-14 TaxID=3384792 RepID=UPI0039A2B8F5